jgi:hypothetical protein
MADELKIDGIESIIPNVSKVNPVLKWKKREKKQHDEASKHFRELARKVEQAHRILSEKNSPYRFCIYQEKGDVFIDVAIVDANSKIKEVFKRNITNDEFQSWMELIEAESGMIFDKEV